MPDANGEMNDVSLEFLDRLDASESLSASGVPNETLPHAPSEGAGSPWDNTNTKAGAGGTLAAAREYLRRGRCVVPIPHGKKGPVIPRWQDFRPAEETLSKHFSADSNIGIILGAPSGGLIDVDLDTREAVAVSDFFLPPTDLVHGRSTMRRSHRWYEVSPSPKYLKFSDPLLDKSDPKKAVLVELRQDGHQTVVPPSVHPSGERYEWARDGEPARVDGTTLSQAVARVAAAALLARHWPAEGQRHSAALALAGMLLHNGWAENDAARFAEAVTTAAGDEEARARIQDLRTTAKRIAEGKSATGAPTLAKILGDSVVRCVREWLRLTVQVSSPETWPDPAPLTGELPPVPPFYLELLPPSFRLLVEDVSERMQTPPDFAACAAIVSLAGCVNRRAVIQPKVSDSSWAVIPNLWGAIVAPPGLMKSPVVRAVTRPLEKIEKLWRDDYQRELAEYKKQKVEAKLRGQAWGEEYKRCIKKNQDTPAPPDDGLDPPVQKRLILTDATFEKLHEILADNPCGVFVVRDELTGWLSQLERQGREGERAFYLEAWNGDGSFTIDRIGRGSIHVPHSCVSLLGNIQPARLRSYLSEVLEGGPGDDGLLQRFQVSTWPDHQRERRLVDRPPNAAAIDRVAQVYSTLTGLGDESVRLRFDLDAQRLFFEWWAELEVKVRGDSGLAPSLVAHLAKYRSLMPTLAGLFELADRAAAGEILTGEKNISVDHAKQAAAFCDYLEAHARRIYSCIVSPEIHSTRELARHIQAGHLPACFTTRSAYLKGWASVDTPERTRAALAILADAAWIRRSKNPVEESGGRPSETWVVNPKVARHA